MDAERFADSIVYFDQLVAEFGGSAAATESHADHARAILGAGKDQLAAGSCTSAVASYKRLATSFSDTSQGQRAQDDLLKPVTVKGKVVRAAPTPGKTPPALLGVVLVKGTRLHTSATQLFAMVKAGFRTRVASDNTFVFTNVPVGEYSLIFEFTEFYEYGVDGDEFSNVADVQPLCGFDFGSVQAGS